MPRFSRTVQAELAQLRQNLKEDLEGVPLYPDAYGDRKFLRFLNGHQHDMKKATEMVRKYVNWRKDNNVDKVRNDIIFGGMDHPTKFPFAELVLRIMPSLPISFNCLDNYGAPICVDQYNFTPSVVLGQINVTDYMVFQTYVLEYKSIIVEQMSEELDARTLAAMPDDAARARALENDTDDTPFGELVYTCMLRDLGAVGFRHLGSDGQEIIKTVVSMASDNYPELLRKCYMINTPWVFSSIWYLIKGWLAERTVAKISLLGGGYMSDLLKDIVPENIPEMVGGSRKENDDEIYQYDYKYLAVEGMDEQHLAAADTLVAKQAKQKTEGVEGKKVAAVSNSSSSEIDVTPPLRVGNLNGFADNSMPLMPPVEANKKQQLITGMAISPENLSPLQQMGHH